MRDIWDAARKTKFLRQYKNLDPQIRKRVNHATQELRVSENPARLGRYKQSKRVFAYDVGNKYRIIYNADWNSDTIEFLRVCNHKSAYGRD